MIPRPPHSPTLCEQMHALADLGHEMADELRAKGTAFQKAADRAFWPKPNDEPISLEAVDHAWTEARACILEALRGKPGEVLSWRKY